MRQPLRLACPNFREEERASLRSLLGLLAPYLRPPWELAEGDAGDLCLLRLDAGDAPPPAAATRWRGCAQHPRVFGPGTLHRPLRAAELLTLLNEAAAEDIVAPAARTGGSAEQLHLLGWPLDFEQGPPGRIRLLAALTAAPCGIEELAQRIEADRQDVARWAGELRARGLVTCETAAARPPPRAAGGWRGLMSRVGRKLGFSA